VAAKHDDQLNLDVFADLIKYTTPASFSSYQGVHPGSLLCLGIKLLGDFDFMTDDWNPDHVSDYEMAWFDRCCLRSYEIVYSKHYRRPTETQSYWCQVRFLEDEIDKPYVVRVLRCLKIKKP
jgi:hypothetical protein